MIHSDFWLFEFSVWLHTFSRSLIAIFIPILLLQTGYSVGSVMLYYFIYCAIDVPLNFFARFLVTKIGAIRVIVIASLFSIAFFFSLFNLEVNNWSLLVLIAFFAAVYDALYWVAHIYLFIKSSKNDTNVSKDASILSIVRQVAGIIAPVLGAFILLMSNSKVLIIASVVVLVLSVVPLLKIKNISDKPKKATKSFRKFFKSWDVRKDYILTSFYGVHCVVESTIWPLFIFLFFNSIESVAALSVIVSITTIIFTFFVGHFTKERRVYMVAVGGVFISLIWLMRLFIENGAFYYFSVFLVGLFSVVISIPLDSNLFEKGEKLDALTTATWRNAVYMFTYMLVFGTLALLISVFKVSFVLAALSMSAVAIVSVIFSGVFFKRKNKFLPF